MKFISNYKFLIIISVLVLALDQIIKKIAQIFEWAIFENSGVAFGLGGSYSELIIYLVILGFILIFVLSRKIDSAKTDFQIAIGLLLGGGISNLLDRLQHGYVLDYVNILNWSYFNLADIAILIGAVFLVIKIWSPKRSKMDKSG